MDLKRLIFPVLFVVIAVLIYLLYFAPGGEKIKAPPAPPEFTAPVSSSADTKPPPAPEPGGTLTVEKTPAPEKADFCLNIKGDQLSPPPDMLTDKEGNCFSRELLKTPAKEGEIRLPISATDFQTAFWTSPLIRLLLLASVVGAAFGAYYAPGAKKVVAVIALILAGGILLVSLQAAPLGSWIPYLDFSWVERSVPSDLTITHPTVLLLVFAGALAMTMVWWKKKNGFFRTVAMVALWGLVAINWYAIRGTDWWPFTERELGPRVQQTVCCYDYDPPQQQYRWLGSKKWVLIKHF